MLKPCPECHKKVSDQAVACPHCGYPLKARQKPVYAKTSQKHMRLPNGFGQITEIQNARLRRPFRVMVTVGKSPEGRPIVKPLQPVAYFATYNEAYQALVEYHRNPFDLSNLVTMDELYAHWYEERTRNASPQALRQYNSVWAYAEELHAMPIRSVRACDLKKVIMTAHRTIHGKERAASNNTRSKMKSTFDQLFDYAMANELVDKNCARTFSLNIEAPVVHKEHLTYTDEEIDLLWENIDLPFVDVVLIQCYSGWRPQELLNLKTCNVDLEKKSFQGGMKTKDGKNRIVPIHSRIYPLVEKRYLESVNDNSEYLITQHFRSTTRVIQMNYDTYLTGLQAIVKELCLNPEHRPHDARVRFVTAAKKAKVDEYAIKILVGHHIQDITEKTYTKRDLDWMRDEIEKIN